MKRLFCPLHRLSLALRLDDGRGPSHAFSRHSRTCPACAAFQSRQEAVLAVIRHASRTQEKTPSPEPAFATRILALARGRESCAGAAVCRRTARRFVAGVAATGVIAVWVLLAVNRRPPACVQAAVSEPMPAFVWAEVLLRGDMLQTEWQRLADETRTLAAGLAEEVRLTLL